MVGVKLSFATVSGFALTAMMDGCGGHPVAGTSVSSSPSPTAQASASPTGQPATPTLLPSSNVVTLSGSLQGGAIATPYCNPRFGPQVEAEFTLNGRTYQLIEEFTAGGF